VIGYESFFGFRESPFSLAPDTRFLFDSASHAEARGQLGYAFERREPLVVVTGAIGTGKTLLCRSVIERVGRTTFVSVISDPQLEPDELLKRMLEDFGVISRDRARLAPTTRHDLVNALQEFLASLEPVSAHAVVIIDEAHHLRPEVLEQIRLVSNVHDARGTLLQIVLAGQPDLDALLSRPDLRQLKQRVTRWLRLEPLTATEVGRYIDHRLTVARHPHARSEAPGARELARALAEWEAPASPAAFTPDAVDTIYQWSRGVPRIVNLLCDRALEAAFAQKRRTVDAGLITAAAGSLKLDAEPVPVPLAASEGFWAAEAAASSTPIEEAPEERRSPARRVAIAAAVVAVVGAAAWWGASTMNSREAAPPAQTTPPPAASVNPPPQRVPETPPATTPAAPPVEPPPEPAPAPAATAPASGTAERFEIVVASFRTIGRADTVAADVEALRLPVRRRVSSGWQQVLVGPLPSRQAAEEAQDRLARAGFTETQIVPAPR
jgi:general secretion pathway protein A